MNVLIFPFGSDGDHHPMIALGLALQQRGHGVTIFANGYFAPVIGRAGLEMVQTGEAEEYLRLSQHDDLWHPVRGFGYLFRQGMEPVMREHYRLIEERQVPGQTLVLSACGALGARVAQERLGVPMASVHLQPATLWSEFESPRFAGMLCGPGVPRWFKRFQMWAAHTLVVDRIACPSINAWRAELGLAPMKGFIHWWHSPQCVLGLWPEWFGPAQPDWPANVHLSGFPLWDSSSVQLARADVEQFLGAGEPPLIFTPGSAHQMATRFFRTAVEAAQRLGRRAILLTRFAEQVPAALPEGVAHFDYVPFSQVFPRAAAVVHHGGIGTTAQAMRAGVPQLIMPMAHDQPDNAARVRRLGIGEAIRPGRFKPRAVASALTRLLDSEAVSDACAAVAGRFGQGSPGSPLEDACGILELFARQVGIEVPAALTQ